MECSSNLFEIEENGIDIDDKRSEYGSYANVSFFFVDCTCTELTQTVKTSTADLISNTGRALGLFLELSFPNAYRFIVYLFDVIF